MKDGLITAAELEQAIVTEFNPTRISFKGSRDIWVNDVLNIGVSPRSASVLDARQTETPPPKRKLL